MTFVYYLTLGYAAATLLTSGIGHGIGFVRFRDIVRSHGVIPVDVAAPAAALVTALELVAGVASLVVLWREEATAWAPLLFAVCAAAGGVFTLYVRRLLNCPDGITSCGCSAFASPLTPTSLVPACTLLLASVVGLTAAGCGFGRALHVAYGVLGISVALPIAWGITLAFLINLLPASVPRPATDQRW